MALMNKAGKILLADDEPDILEIVSYNLIAEGYEVICAKNGNQAIELAKQHLPSMIILDMMMPGKNGIEVCKILRSEPRFKETVIIFLTALSDERSEIRGLETGADDYITKPISPKVLTTKVNALFRRVSKDENPVLQLGELLINREKYNVTYKGLPVTLARKEFELLSLLASKPGKVFLRNEILEKVWGTDVIVGDRTIDVHVRKIRQKIGVDCIATVKGVGYKFELS